MPSMSGSFAFFLWAVLAAFQVVAGQAAYSPKSNTALCPKKNGTYCLPTPFASTLVYCESSTIVDIRYCNKLFARVLPEGFEHAATCFDPVAYSGTAFCAFNGTGYTIDGVPVALPETTLCDDRATGPSPGANTGEGKGTLKKRCIPVHDILPKSPIVLPPVITSTLSVRHTSTHTHTSHCNTPVHSTLVSSVAGGVATSVSVGHVPAPVPSGGEHEHHSSSPSSYSHSRVRTWEGNTLTAPLTLATSAAGESTVTRTAVPFPMYSGPGKPNEPYMILGGSSPIIARSNANVTALEYTGAAAGNIVATPLMAFVAVVCVLAVAF